MSFHMPVAIPSCKLNIYFDNLINPRKEKIWWHQHGRFLEKLSNQPVQQHLLSRTSLILTAIFLQNNCFEQSFPQYSKNSQRPLLFLWDLWRNLGQINIKRNFTITSLTLVTDKLISTGHDQILHWHTLADQPKIAPRAKCLKCRINVTLHSRGNLNNYKTVC